MKEKEQFKVGDEVATRGMFGPMTHGFVCGIIDQIEDEWLWVVDEEGQDHHVHTSNVDLF